ncbi:MAG: hypothetical protein ACKO2C_03955 [Actinomycetes bacterium]
MTFRRDQLQPGTTERAPLRRLRRVAASLAAAVAVVSAYAGAAAAPASAATAPVASLTIYSDGSAVVANSIGGWMEGHAFLAVKNLSSKPITVGRLTGIKPAETVTLGTWGNKPEHTGLWYNLESWFVHSDGAFGGAVSLSRTLSGQDLTNFNSFVSRHDAWNVINNCSTFASEAWNAVSPAATDLDAGLLDTPTWLALSIAAMPGHQVGAAANLPWTNRGVWFGAGSKSAPIRSTSFSEAAPNVTFDEFAVGTAVSNQYAPQGLAFSGTPGPLIATDGANPTSPVLSPGPGYSGAFEFAFVQPSNPGRTTTASGVAFDVGYMDAVGGATVSWYSAQGKLIGQMSTHDYGIVKVRIDAVVARVRVDTSTDPAGAAIDNLEFTLQ